MAEPSPPAQPPLPEPLGHHHPLGTDLYLQRFQTLGAHPLAVLDLSLFFPEGLPDYEDAGLEEGPNAPPTRSEPGSEAPKPTSATGRSQGAGPDLQRQAHPLSQSAAEQQYPGEKPLAQHHPMPSEQGSNLNSANASAHSLSSASTVSGSPNLQKASLDSSTSAAQAEATGTVPPAPIPTAGADLTPASLPQPSAQTPSASIEQSRSTQSPTQPLTAQSSFISAISSQPDSTPVQTKPHDESTAAPDLTADAKAVISNTLQSSIQASQPAETASPNQVLPPAEPSLSDYFSPGSEGRTQSEPSIQKAPSATESAVQPPSAILSLQASEAENRAQPAAAQGIEPPSVEPISARPNPSSQSGGSPLQRQSELPAPNADSAHVPLVELPTLVEQVSLGDEIAPHSPYLEPEATPPAAKSSGPDTPIAGKTPAPPSSILQRSPQEAVHFDLSQPEKAADAAPDPLRKTGSQHAWIQGYFSPDAPTAANHQDGGRNLSFETAPPAPGAQPASHLPTPGTANGDGQLDSSEAAALTPIVSLPSSVAPQPTAPKDLSAATDSKFDQPLGGAVEASENILEPAQLNSGTSSVSAAIQRVESASDSPRVQRVIADVESGTGELRSHPQIAQTSLESVAPRPDYPSTQRTNPSTSASPSPTPSLEIEPTEATSPIGLEPRALLSTKLSGSTVQRASVNQPHHESAQPGPSTTSNPKAPDAGQKPTEFSTASSLQIQGLVEPSTLKEPAAEVGISNSETVDPPERALYKTDSTESFSPQSELISETSTLGIQARATSSSDPQNAALQTPTPSLEEISELGEAKPYLPEAASSASPNLGSTDVIQRADFRSHDLDAPAEPIAGQAFAYDDQAVSTTSAVSNSGPQISPSVDPDLAVSTGSVSSDIPSTSAFPLSLAEGTHDVTADEQPPAIIATDPPSTNALDIEIQAVKEPASSHSDLLSSSSVTPSSTVQRANAEFPPTVADSSGADTAIQLLPVTLNSQSKSSQAEHASIVQASPAADSPELQKTEVAENFSSSSVQATATPVSSNTSADIPHSVAPTTPDLPQPFTPPVDPIAANSSSHNPAVTNPANTLSRPLAEPPTKPASKPVVQGFTKTVNRLMRFFADNSSDNANSPPQIQAAPAKSIASVPAEASEPPTAGEMALDKSQLETPESGVKDSVRAPGRHTSNVSFPSSPLAETVQSSSHLEAPQAVSMESHVLSIETAENSLQRSVLPDAEGFTEAVDQLNNESSTNAQDDLLRGSSPSDQPGPVVEGFQTNFLSPAQGPNSSHEVVQAFPESASPKTAEPNYVQAVSSERELSTFANEHGSQAEGTVNEAEAKRSSNQAENLADLSQPVLSDFQQNAGLTASSADQDLAQQVDSGILGPESISSSNPQPLTIARKIEDLPSSHIQVPFNSINAELLGPESTSRPPDHSHPAATRETEESLPVSNIQSQSKELEGSFSGLEQISKSTTGSESRTLALSITSEAVESVVAESALNSNSPTISRKVEAENEQTNSKTSDTHHFLEKNLPVSKKSPESAPGTTDSNPFFQAELEPSEETRQPVLLDGAPTTIARAATAENTLLLDEIRDFSDSSPLLKNFVSPSQTTPPADSKNPVSEKPDSKTVDLQASQQAPSAQNHLPVAKTAEEDRQGKQGENLSEPNFLKDNSLDTTHATFAIESAVQSAVQRFPVQQSSETSSLEANQAVSSDSNISIANIPASDMSAAATARLENEQPVDVPSSLEKLSAPLEQSSEFSAGPEISTPISSDKNSTTLSRKTDVEGRLSDGQPASPLTSQEFEAFSSAVSQDSTPQLNAEVSDLQAKQSFTPTPTSPANPVISSETELPSLATPKVSALGISQPSSSDSSSPTIARKAEETSELQADEALDSSSSLEKKSSALDQSSDFVVFEAAKQKSTPQVNFEHLGKSSQEPPLYNGSSYIARKIEPDNEPPLGRTQNLSSSSDEGTLDSPQNTDFLSDSSQDVIRAFPQLDDHTNQAQLPVVLKPLGVLESLIAPSPMPQTVPPPNQRSLSLAPEQVQRSPQPSGLHTTSKAASTEQTLSIPGNNLPPDTRIQRQELETLPQQWSSLEDFVQQQAQTVAFGDGFAALDKAVQTPPSPDKSLPQQWSSLEDFVQQQGQSPEPDVKAAASLEPARSISIQRKAEAGSETRRPKPGASKSASQERRKASSPRGTLAVPPIQLKAVPANSTKTGTAIQAKSVQGSKLQAFRDEDVVTISADVPAASGDDNALERLAQEMYRRLCDRISIEAERQGQGYPKRFG